MKRKVSYKFAVFYYQLFPSEYLIKDPPPLEQLEYESSSHLEMTKKSDIFSVQADG